MKGLLLKEFINLKSIAGILIALLLFYLFLHMQLSLYVSFMFVMIIISTFSYDLAAHWDAYALSLPISRNTLVKSKYVLSLLLALFGFFLSAVAAFIQSAISGMPVDLDFFVVTTTSLCALLLFIFICFPLIYKFGIEKGRYIMLLIFLLPTIVISRATVNLTAVKISDCVLNYFLYALPFIVLIVGFLSYFLSCAIIRKKDM